MSKWAQTGTDIFGSQQRFRLKGRDVLLSSIYDGPKKAFVYTAMCEEWKKREQTKNYEQG